MYRRSAVLMMPTISCVPALFRVYVSLFVSLLILSGAAYAGRPICNNTIPASYGFDCEHVRMVGRCHEFLALGYCRNLCGACECNNNPPSATNSCSCHSRFFLLELELYPIPFALSSVISKPWFRVALDQLLQLSTFIYLFPSCNILFRPFFNSIVVCICAYTLCD